MGPVRRSTVQSLNQPECEELLDANRYGRLAVQVHEHPEVFPVNYAMDGRRIVFRVDRGTKLSSIRHDHVASFQIDHIDEQDRTGWSVMAVGPVSEVFAEEEVDRLEDLGLETWVVGETTHWMRLSPHHLSGRRVVRG
jgi:nitroimidazol reductase NimA-like FMN-containing flavoprotein (pyridoxamine 5'-phosphate oxidase superfamily)